MEMNFHTSVANNDEHYIGVRSGVHESNYVELAYQSTSTIPEGISQISGIKHEETKFMHLIANLLPSTSILNITLVVRCLEIDFYHRFVYLYKH